jgi:hypothetical protein
VQRPFAPTASPIGAESKLLVIGGAAGRDFKLADWFCFRTYPQRRVTIDSKPASSRKQLLSDGVVSDEKLPVTIRTDQNIPSAPNA